MDRYLLFALFSSFLAAVAYGIGIKAIRHGQWRPNPMTWLIWCGIDIALITLGYASGARLTLLQLAIYLIGAAIVAYLAIKTRHGQLGLGLFDYLCLIGSVISVGIWLGTGSAQLALIMSIIAQFCGLLPTYRHIVAYPGRENAATWGYFWLSNATNCLAIKNWQLANWPTIIWPVYGLVTISVVMIMLFVFRPIQVSVR